MHSHGTGGWHRGSKSQWGGAKKVCLEHSHAIATDHDMQTWATTATKTTIAFHFSQANSRLNPTPPPPQPSQPAHYDTILFICPSQNERKRERRRQKATGWRNGARPGIVMRTVNKKLPPRQPTTEVVSLFALPAHQLSAILAYTAQKSIQVHLI